MSVTNTVFRSTKGKDFTDIKSFKEAIPKVGNHEVLIEVKAVSLNYRDYGVSNRTYPFPTKDNVVPCSDAAGKVVEVGSGVQDFAVGDCVISVFDPTNQYGVQRTWTYGWGAPQDGFLQNFKVVQAEGLIKLPSDTHLSYSEAASLVCTGTTAWNSLYGGKRFTAGETVLMLGTGGVSITTLILAKAAGAKTIITSSSDEKLKLVQEKYGADFTINYKTHPNWEKEVFYLIFFSILP